MSRIVVLGESPRVDGWALAGAVIVTAVGADDVRRAWDALPTDVDVVITTPAAAEALSHRSGQRLVVVMP